jgi:hypothetical protein
MARATAMNTAVSFMVVVILSSTTPVVHTTSMPLRPLWDPGVGELETRTSTHQLGREEDRVGDSKWKSAGVHGV